MRQVEDPSSNQSRRQGLQQAGVQIMQNENKNVANYYDKNINQQALKLNEKSKSAPTQNQILNQHKEIMQQFDEIPISKIKNMVGYQTNIEMYQTDAKLTEQEEVELPQKELEDSEEGEEGMSLEERVVARQWKVRMRATKEINQLFYNDYANSQSDSTYCMQSFDQFGPLLQEMIKDTNLPNAYEALQCLNTFVQFAQDIKQVAFSCHIYLLEKVNTTKQNFREITTKIILCMLKRLEKQQIVPELLKRFKSKNSKVAVFCFQVVLEALKEKEVIDLKLLFRSINSGLTHQNKDIRDSAYQILKYIYERCKDDSQTIIQQCSNLRPVQIKEFGEDLVKIKKLPNNLSLFDTQDEVESIDIKIKPSKEQVQEPIQHQEQVDLLNCVPDDFSEIPYSPQINTKKKSMEQFNTELQKILNTNGIIKQKDYSMPLNIVFHMLEDKNMLVFMEAIKSVELLSILQQLKQTKIKPFLIVLANKYGETKTAVIAATDKAMATIVKHSLTPVIFADTIINQIALTHKNPRVKQFLLTNPLIQMLQSCKELVQIFKSIQKSLLQLILKDNNDAVRNAAVAVVIEFGSLLQQDDTFQKQLQTLIQQLPKSRVQEITRKLTPEQPDFAKTQQPQKNEEITKPKQDEFQKTLEPRANIYQNLIKQIKQLQFCNPQTLSDLIQEGLQTEFELLQQKRVQLSKALLEQFSQIQKLNKQNIVQIVHLLRELYMEGDVEEIKDFVLIGLLMTELQLDQETGLFSQVLVIACESQGCIEFLELLRDCVEMPIIMNAQFAIKIIQNVYIWLGLKLNHFIKSGMTFADIEELRGFGIKYLEASNLYNEKQRQELISVMIRFKDQISQIRQETLQTLGQQPSARSSQSIDNKTQTAQFNSESFESKQITGELICQTIDKEFEQGLLLFKELAQQSKGLDFETKEMIFNKLLSIVSESNTNQQTHQQQQYRQAYALKALMWMKEEVMGLEDTFKLTAQIFQVYLIQIHKEIDASVELYLLNFWVRELSVRDLADRIQFALSTMKYTKKSKDEMLNGFGILLKWFQEHRLDTVEYRLADLRKIASLICESVLSLKSKAKEICRSFLNSLVERETPEKVLEFMEIQLMHSNDVFLQFLDWFQLQYQPPKLNLARVVPEQQEIESQRSSDNHKQPISYKEQRQQMKQSNFKQSKQETEQVRDIVSRIENTDSQDQGLQEARRSRYDPNQSIEEEEEKQNTLQEQVQQSEAKQKQWVSKIIELEGEKRRIEEETQKLKLQSNHESQAWQQKFMSMQKEHNQVNQNLQEVNQCYHLQVDENEKLKLKIQQMQKQHEDMINRFDQLERKVNSKEDSRLSTPPRNQSRQRETVMNSVAKLQRISDTFCVADQQIGIHKICELLLSVERNVDGELAKPLILHYCKMKTMDERLSMITAIGESLSLNEDILLALSTDVYKALLNFLLRAFAHEKERLDSQSIYKQEANDVTTESQKLVSRLLNSKDFTTSLVSLFQLLREAMPEDLRPQLAIEDGQYLRVLMRCISRITKALHSESSDLIRGFDVLLEMQKIFILCPPENLREDLPSLADFDFVYRGMKEVSDKFIELQPEKVLSFLGYCDTRNQVESAFINPKTPKPR